MPKISVIVPVYKVEEYLNRCIDSILSQSYKDFELILVDDGSPDNCGEICEKYAEKDNRIHVIHKKNGGLSDARNAGIDWAFKNSDSKWITFIDSDDWVHPEYLKSLYETALKYNSSISVCAYRDAESFLTFEKINMYDTEFINTEQLFLNHNTVATVAWGKLYKKEYFSNIRYPFSKINEDEYVTYKLLFQNERIAFIKDQMYFYFRNFSGIMNAKWSPQKLDAIEAMEQQFNYFKKRGSKEVFTFVINKYIWALQTQFEQLQRHDNVENKDYHIKHIRKELRKSLRQRVISKPIEKNKNLYAIAYPKMINIYYFYRRVKKRINRMLHKN